MTVGIGAPNRIRTGVTALRGLCPGPLDDGSAGRVAHYREACRLLKLSDTALPRTPGPNDHPEQPHAPHVARATPSVACPTMPRGGTSVRATAQGAYAGTPYAENEYASPVCGETRPIFSRPTSAHSAKVTQVTES